MSSPARRQQRLDQARTRRARSAARSAGGAIDEELVQEVRGDDEVEAPCDGRKLDRRGSRARRPGPRRPIDRDHLERLPEARPQHAPRRARPGAEIERARSGGATPRRVVDLGQDARQRRLGARRDVAGVLGAQRRVVEVRRPDQRARADQPVVNRRAARAGRPASPRPRTHAYPFPKMSLKLTITQHAEQQHEPGRVHRRLDARVHPLAA